MEEKEKVELELNICQFSNKRAGKKMGGITNLPMLSLFGQHCFTRYRYEDVSVLQFDCDELRGV